MKRLLAIMLVLSLLLPCLAFADGDTDGDRILGEVYSEDNPSRCVTFTYPAQYSSRANHNLEGFTNVYYDDYQYVAVWLKNPDRERLSYFEFCYVTHSARNIHTSVYTLTDQMCAAGVFRQPLGFPCDPFDMLEIGITLDNGYFIKVQSLCYAGQITGCYDLLLDVLGNFVDTDVVAAWLEETWYPQVLAQGEQ